MVNAVNATNKMTKNEAKIKILSLLNEFQLSDKITILEGTVDKLRKQNSIEMANEIRKFSVKVKARKDIDYSPVLKNK